VPLCDTNFVIDVGMITLNQYILLDPILLFFLSGSVMGMVKVRSLQKQSFSFTWWAWLVFTGAMLAGSVSVKFVGVFVVVLCGFYTVAELWEILGDMSNSVVSFLISIEVCTIMYAQDSSRAARRTTVFLNPSFL